VDTLFCSSKRKKHLHLSKPQRSFMTIWAKNNIISSLFDQGLFMLFLKRFIPTILQASLMGLTTLSSATFADTQTPNVSVSIKPLHSIVSAILTDIQTPELIIDSSVSPHDYQLTPKDLFKIKSADILVMAGVGVDGQFKHSNKNAEIYSLEQIEEKLPYLYELRSEHHHGDKDENESNEENHEGHNDDPHFWLNTQNIKVFAQDFSQLMISKDSDNQAIYRANLEAFLAKLTLLEANMQQTLSVHQGTAFLVFHDGYQYFDRQFELNWQGAITEQEDQALSARHLFELKQKIKHDNIQCIFVEPQFDHAKVNQLIKGSDMNIGELDPIGVSIEPGKDLYFTLMQNLANNTADCLK
jgi:zinc transport system substrate-binding protein